MIRTAAPTGHQQETIGLPAITMGVVDHSHLLLALVATGAVGACDDYVVGENLAEGAGNARFAIAYLDREDVRDDNVAWRIDPTVGLVINTSPTGQAMDLAGLEVVSVTDDSPRLDLSFTIEGPVDATLPPGFAAGRLTSGWKWLGPLVPEPRFDDRAPSLQVRIDYLEPPPHPFDATVHATVVLGFDGQEATLPFELAIRSSGELGGHPVGARRVWSVAAHD